MIDEEHYTETTEDVCGRDCTIRLYKGQGRAWWMGVQIDSASIIDRAQAMTNRGVAGWEEAFIKATDTLREAQQVLAFLDIKDAEARLKALQKP